jgi:hypothetical protein
MKSCAESALTCPEPLMIYLASTSYVMFGGRMSSVRFRQTTILDPSSVSAIESEPWAIACRKELQDAIDRAVGGRLEFTRDVLHFYEAEGWRVLKDHEGKVFRTFRDFALARVPEGLQLTLKQFKAFMEDIHKARDEQIAYVEGEIRAM